MNESAYHQATVTVNEERVRDLARSLADLPLSDDFGERMTPHITVDDETAFRAYLWTSAICHATKGKLSGYFHSVHFQGWDFLLRAFSYAAQEDSYRMDPRQIARLTPEELTGIFKSQSTGARVDLPDMGRRAQILRTTARELMARFDGDVTSLLKLCGNTAGGLGGAYVRLAEMSAFRDHQSKKSTAFLMVVHFSRRWKITDWENIMPMVDYHRMRILLRTGCITVEDDHVAGLLKKQSPVQPEVERSIRDAALDACRQLPLYAKMPVFELDVLLWAHARSCCHSSPICISGRSENESFASYLRETPRNDCVFARWCPGRASLQTRALWEPTVETENY